VRIKKPPPTAAIENRGAGAGVAGARKKGAGVGVLRVGCGRLPTCVRDP